MNPLIHAPIDKWSTREKLSLASSVSAAGDQNWYSVSRSLKPFGEQNRPNDWFSQKYCAQQYNDLLEKVETPRRKRGEKNEDTAQKLIVRKLTMERIDELKDEIEQDKKRMDNLKKNINLLKNDNLSETDKKIIEKQMLDALEQKRKDEEAYELWLKEREEKYAQISRKKSFVFSKTPKKDDQLASTPTSKSIPSSATSVSIQSQSSNEDLLVDNVNKSSTVSNEEQQQQFTVKQEKLIAQENSANNETTSVSQVTRLTRDKSKEADKVQITVINEDKRQSITTIESGTKVDDKSKDKTIDQTSKVSDKVEITVQPTEKMEVDNMDSQKSPIKNTQDDRLDDETRDEKEESIASNKRKRTSTSITLSTSITSSPAAVQQPSATQTRRSGRFKPLRQSTTSKTELSTPTSIGGEQTKKVAISNTITVDEQSTPINASQLMLNDDSTKDSTTSDLTDTYTSPNSPASSILNIDSNDPDQVKEYKTWKRAILLIWREIATHKYSTLFTSPVTDDEASGYSTVVLKPIDLTTIRKKVENGQIKSTAEFQRDIMLMFQNAIMYNGVKHEVHQMTLEMQKEILESIEDFINNQKSSSQTSSAKDSQSSSSNRRKSRTM